MPGLSGRELAERLLLSRSEMKRFYTSGFNENVIAHYGILNSGFDFLQKPFTRDPLARTPREVLGPSEGMSEPGPPDVLDFHTYGSTL